MSKEFQRKIAGVLTEEKLDESRFPDKAIVYHDLPNSEAFWQLSIADARKMAAIGDLSRLENIGDIIFWLNSAANSWEDKQRAGDKNGMAKAGFDKLVMPKASFKKVLKTIGASEKPVRGVKPKGWQWKGENALLVTAFNPLTGEHYKAGQSDIDGLVGYVGIEGDEDTVRNAYDLIRRNNDAEYAEAEWGQRSFI